jgi:hypothetical protein
MRLRLTALALCLCATLAGLGAQTARARDAAGPEACPLLKAALRGESAVWTSHLSHLAPTGGKRDRTSCASSPPPGPGHYWFVAFGFFTPSELGSAAAARKDWQTHWNAWRGRPGVTRLRGFGADEAFAVENSSQDPTRHSDTRIFWLKGGYSGTLELEGPGDLGDVQDAEKLLKALMKGIPTG